jgi:hypothetical protein
MQDLALAITLLSSATIRSWISMRMLVPKVAFIGAPIYPSPIPSARSRLPQFAMLPLIIPRLPHPAGLADRAERATCSSQRIVKAPRSKPWPFWPASCCLLLPGPRRGARLLPAGHSAQGACPRGASTGDPCPEGCSPPEIRSSARYSRRRLTTIPLVRADLCLHSGSGARPDETTPEVTTAMTVGRWEAPSSR